MEIKKHFGVYGVCLQEGKLLCIERSVDSEINIAILFATLSLIDPNHFFSIDLIPFQYQF